MKNSSEDNFVVEYTWQELYVLTKHWKSDIQFYKDDIKFLQRLIRKYFIWVTKKENIDKVTKIESSLRRINKKCDSLIKSIDKHLEHLSNLINDPFKYDSQRFKVEHAKLESDISEFIKKFREHKKETFAITEFIVDDEKLMRYLES